MALEQSIGTARELDSGLTANETAAGFIRVRTAGVRDLVRTFQELANKASQPAILQKIVKKGSRPVFKSYKAKAKLHEATGNLAASVDTIYKDYEYGATAVVGPRQTGRVGSSPRARGSANHAWLVEFGTTALKPGTKGRRTYVNVHQMINRRMSRSGSFNDAQFARMGKGYYFLMGSIDEPSRQGQGKPGYSRDFSDSRGKRKQHPITLEPGETIEPMPAYGLMEKSITETATQSLSILRAALENEITARGGAA